MANSDCWKFWIDVGGTFTDCIGRSPEGNEQTLKILSSAITKGRILRNQNALSFIYEPQIKLPDFWKGATITLLDDKGDVLQQSRISRFSAVLPEESSVDSQVPQFAGSSNRLGIFELKDPLNWDAINATLTGQGEIRFELNPQIPAPLMAIHLMQGIPLSERLLDAEVDLGTTRGTNALLTRSGAKTALVTSDGFKDFLEIGDQAREKLFDLNVRRSSPLYQQVIEIDERVLHDGTVERSPDSKTVIQQLSKLKQDGIESLAICLMFGYQYPQHELSVAKIAGELGFKTVRCSSDVAPLIKIVPRGETTVLDAYLDPVIAEYLTEIQSGLSSRSRLRLMTSSGGLVASELFSGKDSLLSGPAGGVVGAARVGHQAGYKRVIGFDMGGTSTDVCRFEGEFNRTFETRKAGVRIVTPMLDIETVASGGGSVCWFDGTRLRVGPQSAGADPGPACYGRNGPLSVTDVNLFLGRIDPAWFPFKLDFVAVERAIEKLRLQMIEAGFEHSKHEIATGLLRIANHNMASAIESVSVACGFDPRDYLLVSFGGAGAQHCCGVADQLGIDKILDHPQASLLSALGIRLADQSAHVAKGVAFQMLPDEQNWVEKNLQLRDAILPDLIVDAIQKLKEQISKLTQLCLNFSVDLRYRGTESSINLSCGRAEVLIEGDMEQEIKPVAIEAAGKMISLNQVIEEFYQLHQHQFGYNQNRPIEIIAVRVEAFLPGERLPPLKTANTIGELKSTHQVVSENSVPRTFSDNLPGTVRQQGPQSFDHFDRIELKPGSIIAGPAIIADRISTTVVDDGWVAKVLDQRVLLLERIPQTDNCKEQVDRSDPANVDPVKLEIFNQHFSSIAKQMGIVLQQTSVSVNVKERLDFSCAIFTERGELVVNAPHIPVHLGAMAQSVRNIIQSNPDVVPGDVFVSNDPYAGGSHLPDITVVTPVYPANHCGLISPQPAPWFWVACRSHHAEIGGTSPGSMPADATCLAEEGVLIQNFRLIRGIRPDENESSDFSHESFDLLRQHLIEAPYPSRAPDENIADLKAQVAANQAGVNRLRELVQKYSFSHVDAYMRHIQAAAERKARLALSKLPNGVFSFSDSLDNGATIRVRMVKQDDHLEIDFAGTDPVLNDNLNANPAIVTAATLYVIRLLIDEDIPLNEGIMKPVNLNLPKCFLNPVDPVLASTQSAKQLPPIVGGNVETSQRLVDCLLGALGLAGASQGTMNNWLMGDGSFGYYETIGGGTGATAAGNGCDAIHCHMTNTRLTDPEILETRYPVILRQFGIRKHSGGQGKKRGGDGMIREIEFLKPLTISLLTSRRTSVPFGMAGGGPGLPGKNLFWRAPASTPPVESVDSTFQEYHFKRDHFSVKPNLMADRYQELPSRCQLSVLPGDRLRIETPGGGGYGSERQKTNQLEE